MPAPEQILASLTAIANQWWWVATAWHVYFAVIAIGLLAGVRPAKRIAAVLLALPLLSVSLFAWAAANPFNGLVLGLVGIALIVLAFRLPDERIEIGPTWAVVAGILMFLFGWVYPHFLDTFPVFAYLYAAPVGLAPCPTLSIVIGVALIVAGFDGRAWTTVLGLTGVFYGIFGTLRLGVTIDFALLAGALLALLVVYMPHPHVQKHSLAH